MNATAAVEQLNIAPVNYSYRMPVELFGTFDKVTGKRLTRRICPIGQLKVLSNIYTFDIKKDGTHGICTRTLELFKRDLNASESTIRCALKFGAEGYIKQVEGRKNAYQFDTDNNYLCGGHYKLEAWMTRPVPFGNEVIKLTNVEQAVASLFNSECNRSPQEFSANDIAEKLDIRLPSAQKAIDKLTDEKFRFVYRKRKGVNGYKKSMYIINRKLFRTLKKAEAKKQKAIDKERAKKEAAEQKESEKLTPNPASFKEAIESEFYERWNRREESVRRMLAAAMEDMEFRTASEELDRLARKLAYAMARKLPESERLQVKEQELTARRNASVKEA